MSEELTLESLKAEITDLKTTSILLKEVLRGLMEATGYMVAKNIMSDKDEVKLVKLEVK